MQHTLQNQAGEKQLQPNVAILLNKIADRIEEHTEKLAVAETWDNGKPVRETLNADIPLAVDHFRYFAGLFVLRKVLLVKLMIKPLLIIFMNHLVSLDKLFRGTSRSLWLFGNLPLL